MNDMTATLPTGILEGLSNEAYHASPAISKSGLWEIYSKTPAHYRFAEREASTAFDFGTACHSAILEPETFEARTIRGPLDRRGGKWVDAQAEAHNTGKLLLTASDYDDVLEVRDVIHADAWLNQIITGGKPVVEASAFWHQPVGDELIYCRARPDLIRTDLGLMLDLKTTADASARGFAKSVADYGYHAQEAHYTRGWMAAGGCEITGTVFLAVEKKKPFAYQLFELQPSAVAEGMAIIDRSLETYARCQRVSEWPAYAQPNGVTELVLPRWAYKETEAPVGAEA